jgi:hypothetical protein
MRSFLIVQKAGRTANKTELAAPSGAGVQTCYQRACGDAPGHLGSDNPVLALSRRRCRATVYTSSAVPGFPNMLLSPRLFRSRSAGSPRSPCPELRPPEVAIRFVRDMAHGFPAFGSSLRSSRHTRRRLPLRLPHRCPALRPAYGSCQLALPSRRCLPSIPSASVQTDLFGNFAGTMQRSDCLGAFIVGVRSRPSRRVRRWTAPPSGLLHGRYTQALPIGSSRCACACSGLRPRRVYPPLARTG